MIETFNRIRIVYNYDEINGNHYAVSGLVLG